MNKHPYERGRWEDELPDDPFMCFQCLSMEDLERCDKCGEVFCQGHIKDHGGCYDIADGSLVR